MDPRLVERRFLRPDFAAVDEGRFICLPPLCCILPASALLPSLMGALALPDEALVVHYFANGFTVKLETWQNGQGAPFHSEEVFTPYGLAPSAPAEETPESIAALVAARYDRESPVPPSYFAAPYPGTYPGSDRPCWPAADSTQCCLDVPPAVLRACEALYSAHGALRLRLRPQELQGLCQNMTKRLLNNVYDVRRGACKLFLGAVGAPPLHGLGTQPLAPGAPCTTPYGPGTVVAASAARTQVSLGHPVRPFAQAYLAPACVHAAALGPAQLELVAWHDGMEVLSEKPFERYECTSTTPSRLGLHARSFFPFTAQAGRQQERWHLDVRLGAGMLRALYAGEVAPALLAHFPAGQAVHCSINDLVQDGEGTTYTQLDAKWSFPGTLLGPGRKPVQPPDQPVPVRPAWEGEMPLTPIASSCQGLKAADNRSFLRFSCQDAPRVQGVQRVLCPETAYTAAHTVKDLYRLAHHVLMQASPGGGGEGGAGGAVWEFTLQVQADGLPVRRVSLHDWEARLVDLNAEFKAFKPCQVFITQVKRK